MARRRTVEPEFQHGMRFVDAQIPEGYTPPSASMDPNATVTPWPRTPGDAEEDR